MEEKEVILALEQYLMQNRTNKHIISSFKLRIERILSNYDTSIPFFEHTVDELKRDKTALEEALKGNHTNTSEIVLRKQLQEINARISELESLA